MSKNFIKKISPAGLCLKKSLGGYTIIETMISISIFLVVVLAGMSALLNASGLHQKSQDMRSLTDNLSFIMEEVSRNIRTGSNYRCISNGNFSTNIDVPQSCSSGGAIAFEYTFGDPLSNADQWVYKIESVDSGATFSISKSVDSGVTWVQLNPSEIVLSGASGFSVLGAGKAPGDSQQPLVLIRLLGTITSKGGVSSFAVQSSVSQRLIDI